MTRQRESLKPYSTNTESVLKLWYETAVITLIETQDYDCT